MHGVWCADSSWPGASRSGNGAFLLSAMAEQIGGDPRSGDIFRQMRGAAAFKVALESARRTGVSAITVAIDFGISRCESAATVFRDAGAGRRVVPPGKVHRDRSRARDGSPSGARLPVAPHDTTEETWSRCAARGDWSRTPAGRRGRVRGSRHRRTAAECDLPVPSGGLNALRTIATHRGPTVTVPTAPRSYRCRAWPAKCWPRRLSPADCRRV